MIKLFDDGFVVTFTDLPKMPNQLNRQSFWYYKKEKDFWTVNAQAKFLPCRNKWMHLKQNKTFVAYYVRQSVNTPDYDGLVSSFKYVQDCIVELGLIPDDSIKHIVERKYDWKKAPKRIEQGILLSFKAGSTIEDLNIAIERANTCSIYQDE